uniref:Uncharacterized protein n=1 Tax=Oryza brachyantha TaxID=4533 RepID=J3LC17_ORYBR
MSYSIVVPSSPSPLQHDALEHEHAVWEVDAEDDGLFAPPVDRELEEPRLTDARLGEARVEACADELGQQQLRQPNLAKEGFELGMLRRVAQPVIDIQVALLNLNMQEHVNDFRYEALRREAQIGGSTARKVLSYLTPHNPLQFHAAMSMKLSGVLEKMNKLVVVKLLLEQRDYRGIFVPPSWQKQQKCLE